MIAVIQGADMNRTVTLEVLGTSPRNGDPGCEATLEEELYCLYRCDRCGKTVLTPVLTHFKVREARDKSGTIARSAVIQQADVILDRIKDPDLRSVADLDNAHIEQKCPNCGKQPIWTVRLRIADFLVSKYGPLVFILYLGLIGLLSGIGLSSSTFFVLYIFATVFYILGFFVKPERFCFLLNKRRIMHSVQDTLPLYGETLEEIEVHARNLARYHDLSFDGIRQCLEKKRLRIIVK